MQSAADEASQALAPSTLPGVIAFVGILIITVFFTFIAYTRRSGQDD
jgi:hypothetical protein